MADKYKINPYTGKMDNVGPVTDAMSSLISSANSTGILSGGALEINALDDTTFDITEPVVGFVIDNTTDPEHPTATRVTFPVTSGISCPHIADVDTPVSEFWFYYLSKSWRDANAPHNDGYTCDFESTWGYSLHNSLGVRNQAYQEFALTFHKEAAQDLIATIVKR